MARSRSEDAFGVTVSGYAAGFLPVPLAVTVFLLVSADDAAQKGSVDVLWALLASIPAALVFGPMNARRTLTTCGDALADQTGKACVLMGLVGLFVQALLLVPFLYLGWIGLVADVALTAALVPALARQRVLTKVEEDKIAARVRRGHA